MNCSLEGVVPCDLFTLLLAISARFPSFFLSFSPEKHIAAISRQQPDQYNLHIQGKQCQMVSVDSSGGQVDVLRETHEHLYLKPASLKYFSSSMITSLIVGGD